MNVADLTGPPAGAQAMHVAAPSPAVQAGRFYGSARAFFGLLVRGSLLLLLTLGIYRFWLATDVRRFLWGHTEVAGELLEYTGTARELLIGFLMALAFLVPVNLLIFLATFAPGFFKLSGVLGFVLLTWLGHFARYRARRYRLTRTVYRGIRFYQTGAGWRYAAIAMLWWTLTLLTAGLSYPWMVASLERYKLRNTFYGNLGGRFVGSGTRLFFRGVLLWALVVGPFVAGVVAAIGSVDWAGVMSAVDAGANVRGRLDELWPGMAVAVVLAISGIGWAFLAAALLYPLFRAMVLRWWISGVRLGGIEATSHLRGSQVYGIYLRFVGFSLLFAMGTGIVGSILVLVVRSTPFGSGDMVGAVLGVAGYVIVALGYSAIYQATVTLRYWVLSFETTGLTGVEALEHVQARGEAASAFGEGLSDALDVGGL
jgi:uncharacterized membrane protein YjgN (DUF898 family)